MKRENKYIYTYIFLLNKELYISSVCAKYFIIFFKLLSKRNQYAQESHYTNRRIQ